MSLTKYQLKDKFIKTGRYSIIDWLRTRIKPGKTYIKKGDKLYYIQKEKIEYLNKKQIIELKGNTFFQTKIVDNYFEIAKKDFFTKKERPFVFYYLKEAYHDKLFEIPNVKSYLINKSKVLYENQEVNIYFVMGKHNYSIEKILKYMFEDRFGSDIMNIFFTKNSAVGFMNLLEEYMTFPILVEDYKLCRVYTNNEEKDLHYVLDMNSVPENVEISASEMKKYFHIPTFNSILRNLYFKRERPQVPRKYRKMLNKKTKLKGKRKLISDFKNGNLDYISVLDTSYIKDASWYW